MTENSVTSILDRLEEAGQNGSERVSVGKIVGAIRTRGYGPFLFVPGLVEPTPIGAIPGVPTVLALIVLLFSGQMLVGKTDVWLPKMIANRSISAETLQKSIGKLRTVGRWLARWFRPRVEGLAGGAAIRIAALATICLALTVPFLEIFPLASSAPMIAIAVFGLAILFHDGLLMAIAWLVSAASLVLLGTLIFG